MIPKSERQALRKADIPLTVALLDHADEADRIIAEMLRQADLAGPGCAMRVRGAVPDEWLPEGEGA